MSPRTSEKYFKKKSSRNWDTLSIPEYAVKSYNQINVLIFKWTNSSVEMDRTSKIDLNVFELVIHDRVSFFFKPSVKRTGIINGASTAGDTLTMNPNGLNS